MRSSLLFAAAVLAGTASAQLTASSSASKTTTSSSTTTSRVPTVQTVDVGKGGHTFNPINVKAQVGDIITFQFWPLNHSVARSDYKYPCIPYEDLAPNRKGFFSGFEPVSDPSALTLWNLTINDTQPIWYYCTAPGSCINYGMIGAINPPSNDMVGDQQQRAKNAQFMLQPGEAFPAEDQAAVTSAAAGAATASPSPSATATTSPSPSPSPTPAAKSGLGGGAIAGIVIGAIFALAVAGALFYFIGRSRSLKQTLDKRDTHQNGPMSDVGSYAPSSTNAHNSTIGGNGHWSTQNSDFANGGRWPSHHGLPTYAAAAELKHGGDAEVGSVRSSSPPTAMPTPYMGTFPAHLSHLGSSPPTQQGEWYFRPSGNSAPGPLHAQPSAELSAGGQAIHPQGVFRETGLDAPAPINFHELDAQRASLLRSMSNRTDSTLPSQEHKEGDTRR